MTAPAAPISRQMAKRRGSMKTRRKFLTILGGGVVFAAATGSWALTRDPTSARAPWTVAGQVLDGDDAKTGSGTTGKHENQGFLGELAGEPGFEPRLTESESVVLPLNYSPPGYRFAAIGERAYSQNIGHCKGRFWKKMHMAEKGELDATIGRLGGVLRSFGRW